MARRYGQVWSQTLSRSLALLLQAETSDALDEKGGVDACLRSLFDGDVTARFGGCQGVRAGVRPAMPYEEGEPLLVARGEGRIGDFPAFPFLMLLPPLV